MKDALYTLLEISSIMFLTAFSLTFIKQKYKRSRLEWLNLILIGPEITTTPTTAAAATTTTTKNENNNKQQEDTQPKENRTEYLKSLAFSVVGLQASYLLWGVLQEKIMTTSYQPLNASLPPAKFPSTSLLVLSNRVFAIAFSYLAIKIIPQPKHVAPFVDYSFAAVANTLSSYCQYEALRFVSFPMQTVSKACKIIPTMLMGKVVQNKTYSFRDYASAWMITIGVAVFALDNSNQSVADLLNFQNVAKLDGNGFIGFVLLCCYLVVDAFTSNWQNHLFQQHHISPYQCMLGINIFSTILGLMNLYQTNQTSSSILFLFNYPSAVLDVSLMSFTSAIGQLFIYYTIEKHGSVVFAIISVTRQLLSIVLSSFYFDHYISPVGWLGVALTFSGILYNSMGGGGGRNAKVKKQ